MNFSIVIPLYNQVDMASWHVKFYNALYKIRQDFEVIFEDDGSSDSTQKYMEAKGSDKLFPYTYSWSPNIGFTVAAAKNRAIRKAKGSWLLIIDGDTFVDPETLRAYDRIQKDENTVYFGKRYSVAMKSLDKALHYGFPTVIEDKRDWRGFLQDIPPAPFWHFSGANFLVSRKVAKELGYAPGDWLGYGYDDYYMAINYLIHDKKFQAVNDSVAYHCEDKPKEGDPVTRKRLNDLIDEHELQLRVLGQPIKKF